VKFAIPIVPPGRQTRSSSAAVARWSGAKIAPNADVTPSNSASPNGSACASATTRSSSAPAAAASTRPAVKCSGVMSLATTSAPACAARIATFLVPHATSSTRRPGPIAQASTSTRPTSRTVSFARTGGSRRAPTRA
jgi:hypothetical protein